VSEGNALWRALAGPRAPRRGDEAIALERAIEALLARLTTDEVEGCWIDLKNNREPVWIGSPAAERARAEYR
jgi:hypothetical protein